MTEHTPGACPLCGQPETAWAAKARAAIAKATEPRP